VVQLGIFTFQTIPNVKFFCMRAQGPLMHFEEQINV